MSQNSSNQAPAPVPVADRSETGVDHFELRVEGFQGTPEEIERQWFEQVYRGRGDTMPQLTLRAVVMGSVLGGVLSLTNLYIGLKSGWGFGVAITACILSYAIWTSLHKIGVVRTRMTILENNCMQSTASAAGYSTGTTLVSRILRLHPDHRRAAAAGAYAGLGVLPGRAGGDHGHPDEAADDQRGAAPLPQRRGGGRDACARCIRTGRKGMRAAKALGMAGGLAALSSF